MARIRSVKPEFFKHLELNELENKYPKLKIMLSYEGLWTQCDKNGVFLCNAKVLKNEILPYVNFDMQATLDVLEKEKYFIRFQANNREYGYIPNFGKYQFPSKNEKESPAKYPLPPENVESAQAQMKTCSSTDENVPEHHTEPEGRRIKDKGIQEKGITDSLDSSNEPPIDSFTQKQALELSELLLKLHRNEFPDYLSGKKDAETVSRWAVDLEKLIRIDKKSPENIRQIIHWIKTPDNFWFSNIESGKKLRQQYEKLWSQMQTRGISPEEKKAIIRERISEKEKEKSDMVLADYEKSKMETDYNNSLVDAFKAVVNRETKNEK